MKKIAILLAFLIASWIGAHAQEFHFIPRIGLNLSSLYPIENYRSMRAGLNIGVAEEIRFSRLFALEPGIYYSMQGYRRDYSRDGNAYLKADYLNIPVYAKFYLWQGFHLFAGPQVSFNVRAKATDYIFSSSLCPPFMDEEYHDASGDIREEIRNCGFSLVMGAGYTFDWGLVVSANYILGCTPFFSDTNDFLTGGSSYFQGKGQNSVLQINVGWRF